VASTACNEAKAVELHQIVHPVYPVPFRRPGKAHCAITTTFARGSTPSSFLGSLIDDSLVVFCIGQESATIVIMDVNVCAYGTQYTGILLANLR
jgi:hypothetical protein